MRSRQAPVTTSELIQRLRELDPTGQRGVIYMCCSDWSPLAAEDVTLEVGIDKDFYVMRDHPTVPASDAVKRREYIAFPGN